MKETLKAKFAQILAEHEHGALGGNDVPGTLAEAARRWYEGDEWEYRARLQSCGFVAEGYISAQYAMDGLKRELEEHPYLEMDDTAIVERALIREWLPVKEEI